MPFKIIIYCFPIANKNWNWKNNDNQDLGDTATLQIDITGKILMNGTRVRKRHFVF